jgi:hypothetical protein
MASIATERRGVNPQAAFAAAVCAAAVEADTEQVLGRSPYVRRARIGPWVEGAAACHRCHWRQSQRFLRNGHRNHRVLTPWGEVTVAMSRVVCVGGGSVQFEMESWLRPYQRIGEDVAAQIQRWGGLWLSLREMQAELAHLHLTPLALRTLMTRLHQVATPVVTPTLVPPVLQVDTIWVTFLTELEAAGICGDNGLELIMHDGGTGLCGATASVRFDAAEQRCPFHKLRNPYHAIRVTDDTLSHKAQRRAR